jgi:hypothetical protein
MVDTNKIFGDAPPAFTDLVDLSTEIQYFNIIIYNSFDVDISLQFDAPTEEQKSIFIMPPGSWTQDNFMHNGLIKWKYTTTPPTTGIFKMANW